MQREENISLREQAPAPDLIAEEMRDTEQEPPGLEQTTSRRRGSKTNRACVLIGNGILQLPIWGFAMSYGVFQEYFSAHWTLPGSQELTGIIGTTFNGVMYLSMPFLFVLFTRRYARWRRLAALCGAALTCASFLLSSFATDVWHLIVTQGVLAALGCALIYSPTTLSLGERFHESGRALAYGITLSCKNVVGSVCPFILRALLDRYGASTAVRVWTALVAGTSIPAILLIPAHDHHHHSSSIGPSGEEEPTRAPRKTPWYFLRHRTIYVYSVAIALQSSGYGIPQTYLSAYAHDVALLSQTSATLLLTIFNLPGIISSSFFGYLSNNSNGSNSNRRKKLSLSASAVTSIPAVGSALAAFLLWGLTSRGSMALLVLFSVTFGFFAGGYSATWGGVLDELEREAREGNEAVDTGLLYGLLNGARGVGYVGGGLAGVPLLRAGSLGHTTAGAFGYGTAYGPLIIFTGLSSVFGGWAVLWKLGEMLCLV